jgi:predicted DNA-binding mobile mystery protein A
MNGIDSLRIRQLDDALVPFSSLRSRPPPPKGWLRSIREALGMSLRQVAERAGVSKTSVQSAELNEAKGTIQLDSLQKLADALDCDLVYALVPRSSLAGILEGQARANAERIVGRVSDSMDLEAQGVAESERQRQIHELAATIIRERGRDFWDV